MKYGINFKVSVNGRARKADVTVTDEDGKLCTTDRVQAFDGQERRKLIKRLAKRLKVEPEKLEDPVELAWAAEADRLAKAKKAEEDAASCAPETPDSPDSKKGEYLARGWMMWRRKYTRDGEEVLESLCNFDARIVQQIVHDDGAEQRVFLEIEGTLHDGRPLPRVEVPADRLGGMEWIIPKWGVSAILRAGNGTRDHLRAALQVLSGNVPGRIVYGHTGWRAEGDRWLYLHAGGAIGGDGAWGAIDVTLPGELWRYELPAPPEGERLVAAIRASLGLLNGLAPDRIIVPLLAAPYRAVLGNTDFAMHLTGQSGVYKSELAALAQQHHGASLTRTQLPGSWSSTENALETIAFAVKDGLLTIDDFAPRGSTNEVQGFHRKADRVFRAQGNRSGRQRLWADGRLRPERPPRGLVLSTGEEVPSGASIRARLLIVEVGPGEVNVSRLTECQRDAEAGLYAESLSGFIRWLAPHLTVLRDRLPQEQAALRANAIAGGQHARTPGIVADLTIGLHYVMEYALDRGAITPAERNSLAARTWAALAESAAAQADHIRAADPVDAFFRFLLGAIASGRGHLAGPSGLEPHKAEAWGWQGTPARVFEGGNYLSVLTYVPRGRRLGWVDGNDVYLEPEAAHAEAQELARQQGESLPVSARTLRKRLKDGGLLANYEEGKTTTRRQLEGRERTVIHLRGDTLIQQSGDSGVSGAAVSNSNAGQEVTPPPFSPGYSVPPPVNRGAPVEPGAKTTDTTGNGAETCAVPPPNPPNPPTPAGVGGTSVGDLFSSLPEDGEL